MKKILCLILFLNLSPLAFAIDLNWSLTSSATGNPCSGAVENVKDDDVGTNVVCSVSGGAFNYTVTLTFTEIVTLINSVDIVHQALGNLGNLGNWSVDLYYNSNWNTVMSGSWTTSFDTTDSDSTGWSNVEKIRVNADGAADPSPARVGHLTKELRAWGPPNYIDIGLRIRTSSGTIKIGVQDLDGHKLRIRKGNTTYGIPLLATNDANASGLRIYDGSSVKALPKVD